MKTIEILLDEKSLLKTNEVEFLEHKRNGTLNELFKPVIFFCGEAAFSGNNYYLYIQHQGRDRYTVKIEPKTKWDTEKNCRIFIPGIDDEIMLKIYNYITKDINNSKQIK